MSELWWYETNDAYRMLEAVWMVPHSDVRALKHNLHRYYLACCRAIWTLLPNEDSRWGVESGERYLAGEIGDEELSRISYWVEGAAFTIHYNTEPEAIARWVENVRCIPERQLRSMLHPHDVNWNIQPRDLLQRAAYFADFAMLYPILTPGGTPPEDYAPFLCARLLREFVDNPFRSECSAPVLETLNMPMTSETGSNPSQSQHGT